MVAPGWTMTTAGEVYNVFLHESTSSDGLCSGAERLGDSRLGVGRVKLADKIRIGSG